MKVVDSEVSARAVAELPALLPIRPNLLRRQRIAFGLGLALPALGTIAAPIVSFWVGFSWVEPTTFLIMLVVYGLGIEAGYHRLFSHNSYETKEWIRVMLAIAGNTAFQGPVVYWVAHHRLHHATADRDQDPHSPHNHPRGRLAGFIHAHVGWFFSETRASPGRFARDLLNDRTIMAVNRLNALWLLLAMLIPTLIGGLGTWSWQGALVGFLWGGMVRTCFGQHCTYLINSWCHIFGTTPYKSSDHAKNAAWLWIPTFGAALHNNHHAFPTSAIYDFRWWQIDLSGWFIRFLASLGLAWNLKRPTEAQLRGRRT